MMIWELKTSIPIHQSLINQVNQAWMSILLPLLISPNSQLSSPLQVKVIKILINNINLKMKILSKNKGQAIPIQRSEDSKKLKKWEAKDHLKIKIS